MNLGDWITAGFGLWVGQNWLDVLCIAALILGVICLGIAKLIDHVNDRRNGAGE